MNKPSSVSGKKPRALFLAAGAPYPMIGGGAIRAASLIEYLAQRFAVHLILFHQPGAPDPRPAIPPGRVDRLDLIELPYHSKRPAARLIRNLRRLARNRPPLIDRFSGFGSALSELVSGAAYDIAVLDHFWCAPYLEQVRPTAQRVLLDLPDVESAWHSSMAASASLLPAAGLRRFAKASTALERTWMPKFDSILVTSCEDAKLVRGIAADREVIVYPNALPEIPLPQRTEQPEIIFSGNLEYPPNVGAVRFFRQRVWPVLRAQWPELTWKILGRYPEAILGLVSGDPRIQMTGAVNDAVPILAQAQVAVVPVLAGSGTRIKILEAWAGGTPVVSTTMGAQGLLCRHQEHLLLADDPASFAAAVSSLLASAPDRARIGTAGRRLYESHYTWPAAWKALESILM